MRRIITHILLTAALTTASPLAAAAQDDSIRTTSKHYSQEQPLVYEDAWDLWPYIFLNETGEPDGYNADLLKIIFKELGIPYIIKLKPSADVLEDIRSGRADLTLEMDADYTEGIARFGTSVVQLFTYSVVAPKGLPTTIRQVDDLAREKVIVRRGSFSHHFMESHGWGENALPFDDMKDAMQQVISDHKGQILCNSMSLKFLLRKYQASDLEITPVKLPSSEYKFMSNDTRLLAQMDSVYTQLRSSGQLQAVQNKWFYPERRKTGIPSWIWELAAVLSLVAAGILVYYAGYRIRERKLTKSVRKSNARLALILQTSSVRIWTYDITTRLFTWMDGDGKPAHTYTTTEFSQRYPDEDFQQLSKALAQLASEEIKSTTLELKAKDGADDEVRDFVIALSVLRHDKHGRPSVIIGTKSDVTEEHQKQTKAKRMMLRYQSAFSTEMANMMFFDEDGRLTDINEKACRTFGYDKAQLLERRPTYSEIFGIGPFPPDVFNYFYATLRLKDMFYEIQLVPVYDSDHHLLGIYQTGRDVTEYALSCRKQQEGIDLLRQSNKEVNNYLDSINYVLNVGGVRIADYFLDTHLMKVYSKAGVVQYSLTPARCLSLVADTSKRDAIRIFNSMDHGTTDTIEADIETTLPWHQGRHLWLHVNFVPILDGQGAVEYYYGMFRDISEIKTTENELELQTVKAQNIENVKNSFLRNMSYEIRTPLNTVVGFAELFEMEHGQEDEAVFITEIKENSSKLLKLINDILFLSRLDADMIEIKPRPVDFALTFESRCQAAWAVGQQAGVSYVVQSPYEHLNVEIDEANLGIVLEKVITNAVQHTTSGSVLARYDYIGDQLVVSVEDTGCGIPESAIGHIFERFVTGASHGAGLGLSICHELIQHMGGTININSVEGKGTTVWFTVACKATEIVRK